MDFLSNTVFGYVSSPQDQINILGETGYFYILIGVCYLVSFGMMRHQSTQIAQKTLYHLVSILLWFLSGALLLNGWGYAIPAMISIFATYNLLFQNFIVRHLMKAIAQHVSNDMVENEKLKTILEKSKSEVSTLTTFPFLNDRILWLLILFKSLVAARAVLFY